MTRRTRLALSIAIAVLVVAGVIWWQVAKLSNGLRTMPAGGAGELLIGSLSTRVLAPGVDGRQPTAHGARPILDLYRSDPELTHTRYLLVMTWLHASEIFRAVGPKLAAKPSMMSSVSVPGIAPRDRVDGWGMPYCIFASATALTVLSGGGRSMPNCERLRRDAERAASNSTDSRLTRDGDLLVAVYKRGAAMLK